MADKVLESGGSDLKSEDKRTEYINLAESNFRHAGDLLEENE